jgi:hypothetical protein
MDATERQNLGMNGGSRALTRRKEVSLCRMACSHRRLGFQSAALAQKTSDAWTPTLSEPPQAIMT